MDFNCESFSNIYSRVQEAWAEGEGATEGCEMVDGITGSMDAEFKQTLGDTEGQEACLLCCRPRVTKNQMCLSDWNTTTRNPSVIEETNITVELITYLTCLFFYMFHLFF